MARYSQKTAKTAHTFSLFYHLEFSGLIHKWPSYSMFFSQFLPADEFVFTGLVVQSCHFDFEQPAPAGKLIKICNLKITQQSDQSQKLKKFPKTNNSKVRRNQI